VVIDGMFEPDRTGRVIFSAATGPDANAIAQVQAQVCRRLLRSFVRRELLTGDDARAMAQWEHGGGFSVDASVRIDAADWQGDERAPAVRAGGPTNSIRGPLLARIHVGDRRQSGSNLTEDGMDNHLGQNSTNDHLLRSRPGLAFAA
jgi:hypothetical protein